LTWILPVIVTISAILSVIVTYILILIFRKIDITGIDIFKIHRPRIPSNGGLSVPITVTIIMSILLMQNLVSLNFFLSIVLSLAIITIIGLIDDYIDLPGFYKPLAAMFAGVPIVLFAEYDYHFKIILGGGFSIPIIYPLAILIAISVTSNTVNMLDVINGSATWGVFISLIAGMISSIILSSDKGLLLSIIFLSSLMGVVIFNTYPAKVFLGNSGSLSMGCLLGILAILGDIELPVMVAMFPFIHNSFFFLSHAKKFVEHKTLNTTVTFLNDKGLIEDANNQTAPITLLRFLVSEKPKSELRALSEMIVIFIISSALAIITAYLMTMKVM
jgi:UDP-N-acetylglucosamine--dolichyl-phosphate N-acetylglucosaminephosphotransferase